MDRLNLWREGRQLFQLDLGGVAHRYPFMLIHSQADTEALLAEALADRGVSVERGVALRSAGVEGEGVTAELVHGDGRVESIRPDVLLGADGPGSTVRKSLGIGFPGTSYEEPWRLYDLELDTPLPRHEASAFLLNYGGMFMVRIHHEVWRVLGNVPDLLNRLLAARRPGPSSGNRISGSAIDQRNDFKLVAPAWRATRRTSTRGWVRGG